MTRTARCSGFRAFADNFRGRFAAGLRSKTAAYAGAGFAIAGVTGASVAAGLSGATASAGPLHQVSRPAANHPVADHAAAANRATRHPVPTKHQEDTWASVSKIVASRTYPKPTRGPLPAQDQLTPVGTVGPQSSMPITTARYDNAKTIVLRAIDKHMGLRSAVIAVATSMQESTLLNLKYGTGDSLGLFQQRPSSNWGTPAQIKRPVYASDAFLSALRSYQARNPDWAHQPLWQAAQGVQASAFPTAYAKWESQAAKVVASVTKKLL